MAFPWRSFRRAVTSCAAVAFGLSACAPHNAAPAASGIVAALPPALRERSSGGSAQKIQHVVIVVQENRSFDNLFYGYPGADTATEGQDSHGNTIPLAPLPLEAPYPINHLSADFFFACNGTPPGHHCKMNGFDRENTPGPSGPDPEYAYVPASETAPLFSIAHEFVLGDRMFPSQFDASFTSHQYIIAGQANHTVNTPSGPWGCGGGKDDVIGTVVSKRAYGPYVSPCFNSQTIADELVAKGLSWRYYASGGADAVWMGYRAIRHIYKSSQYNDDVVNPPTRFLKDVARGTLANVTWITPTCAMSDWAGCKGNKGPDWVASIVNAVGQSQFWDTTTIFVFWDDWGGWYDHVAPPWTDFDGLGIRVPLLIVSPYAKKGHVSHVQYEHGSILKYVEGVFGLAPLAASDRRANSVEPDSFDYNRAPRAFVPIPTTLRASDFSDALPDDRPIDDQ